MRVVLEVPKEIVVDEWFFKEIGEVIVKRAWSLETNDILDFPDFRENTPLRLERSYSSINISFPGCGKDSP